MKTIKLNKGYETIVDDDVYEWASKNKWKYNQGYVIRSKWPNSSYRLHRLIMNASKGIYVDHIDGNPLNNLRSNLRLCSNAENGRNQKLHKNNTSGYKGVHWSKLNKKWKVEIKINYKNKFIGLYNTKEDAAKAYNEAALKYFGEFARLNKIGESND